ncbi:hypothetical protein N7532_009227 [Penicillium argentinense]|uniref:Uncharacterized protein n=1 Tax=Penicillium argentinense TaxID=1131581 RepID=A0A9W9EYZ1_9EURO|nr:uncharacterized protein N7532_009227 [Penicillium argentinense]KAJ5090543.1 hypothetical protein N7532_009227 [Penicillium argentinense]
MPPPLAPLSHATHTKIWNDLEWLAVPADVDVNNALSCAVKATSVGVNSVIASEYSVYSSSTAAAAAAAQSAASAALKISGDIAIAL